MKKNQGPKVKLNRETLRALEQPDLATAAAAVNTRPFITCTCCNGTRLTCSSVYC